MKLNDAFDLARNQLNNGTPVHLQSNIEDDGSRVGAIVTIPIIGYLDRKQVERFIDISEHYGCNFIIKEKMVDFK